MREMKDSGIAWIGEIPKEWEVCPIKRNFAIYAGATPKSDNPTFWDGDIAWITPADYKTEDRTIKKGRRSLTQEGFESCATYLLPVNSVIFSKRAPIGLVVINKETLCTNQGCLGCVPYDKTDSVFFYYTMSAFTKQYELYGSGTTFKEISATDFANFELPVPPLSEQRLIANFLDEKCGEIDELVALQEKMIDELKAYKQSVITETVTKGLDKNVKMKDSGVEWIGEIPEHWEVVRTKYLLNERKERSEYGIEEPLSMSQKYGLIPTKEMDIVPNMASSFVGAKLVYQGDLVFNKLKAHLGVFATSSYEGLVSPDYAVYYNSGQCAIQYLEYLFKTPIYISEFVKLSTGVGAGLTRLYTSDLFAIPCLLPPFEEQQRIIDHIYTKCSEIDSLISIKQKKIEKLKDYKKSLIYEYVTGKKQVG